MTIVPQGRVTLISGSPVLIDDVTGATTIYYTPAVGNRIPLWNGLDFSEIMFVELSQSLSDTTTSPAASAADSNYDMFVWINGGSVILSRGPAWSSDVSRGSGSGTTELEYLNGVYVNAVGITNGPAARKGTFVGTIRTNAGNSVDMMFAPTGSSGGTANNLFVWNMYNRHQISSVNYDTTENWEYSSASWQVKNASSNNAIFFVCGITEDAFDVQNTTLFSGDDAGQGAGAGIGLDGTTSPASSSHGGYAISPASGIGIEVAATFSALPAIGFHFVAPLEISGGAGTLTWSGWMITDADVPLPFSFAWMM